MPHALTYKTTTANGPEQAHELTLLLKNSSVKQKYRQRESAGGGQHLGQRELHHLQPLRARGIEGHHGQN